MDNHLNDAPSTSQHSNMKKGKSNNQVKMMCIGCGTRKRGDFDNDEKARAEKNSPSEEFRSKCRDCKKNNQESEQEMKSRVQKEKRERAAIWQCMYCREFKTSDFFDDDQQNQIRRLFHANEFVCGRSLYDPFKEMTWPSPDQDWEYDPLHQRINEAKKLVARHFFSVPSVLCSDCNHSFQYRTKKRMQKEAESDYVPLEFQPPSREVNILDFVTKK